MASYIGLAILVLVLYSISRFILATWRFRKLSKKHGCEEPFRVSGRLPSWRRFHRMLNFQKAGEDLLDDVIAEDFLNGSTVQMTAFEGTKVISTTEPANIQAMLATQFEDFGVGWRRYHSFKPLLGNSIFTSDGAFWRHSRQLFRPQFSRDNLNDLEMTDRAVGDLIGAIGRPDEKGWTVATEMMPLLYNFTLDTATDFLFGESIDSQVAATAEREGKRLDSNDPEKAQKMKDAKVFSENFDIINHYLVLRIRLQSFWWAADNSKFRAAVERVRTFTDHFVKLATDSVSTTTQNDTANEKSPTKKNSLLNNLATQTQDREELRFQTLAILSAGRDTTSAFLGWAIAQLSLNPEIFTKLRNIILREFPPGEEITFAKLKGCRYLQHVLNEVLRLHPTVPVNQRVAVKDTTLPVGGGADQRSPIAIPKDRHVMFSVYLMHRRKDLWGADAAEFRPERWEERIPAWQFLPFLGGPRICLGQQFALTEASYLLVRLMQEFNAIEPADWVEMSKLRKGLGVTMWPKDHAKVRFHKAGM